MAAALVLGGMATDATDVAAGSYAPSTTSSAWSPWRPCGGRSDRFSTGFSLATQVEDSLDHLVRRTAELNRPLILSYPDDGLLATRDVDVSDVIRRHRKHVEIIRIAHTHSTMGGTPGSKLKDTTKCIYVAS